MAGAVGRGSKKVHPGHDLPDEDRGDGDALQAPEAGRRAIVAAKEDEIDDEGYESDHSADHVEHCETTPTSAPEHRHPQDENGQVSKEERDQSAGVVDRKSTRLNSSHEWISYAVFCLKKK